jgi:murein L,D-transpeptidase YcbB/YkuD
VLDALALLGEITTSDTPDQVLADLAPDNAEFIALRDRLASLGDGGTEAVQIGEGESIKSGARDLRVVQLRERLGVAPVEEDADLYDEVLVEAVRNFQTELGLTPDGIVGTATRNALNRAGNITRAQIVVNMEKWRWLPRDLGDFYVHVNIPEFRLWIKSAEVPVYETRVVVGTSTNQTPIFYDQIRHVVVNPYWNVPSSIARGEIGPQVMRDPSYLGRRNIELLNAGRVIDPYEVDWSSVPSGSFPFQLRQRPGAQNALGQVKFLFPNKHDVYLHDTPEKSLFGRDSRAYSHGCVRVQNPFEFAAALLEHEPKLDAAMLVDAFGPKERWFNLEVRVPVYLTYFTVRADQDGNLRSFADLYGHDAKIAAVLSDDE